MQQVGFTGSRPSSKAMTTGAKLLKTVQVRPQENDNLSKCIMVGKVPITMQGMVLTALISKLARVHTGNS